MKKNFEEDVEYINANTENKALKEKAALIEKDITTSNFEISQLNESIKMA